jgi:hypothetical protein
MTFEVPITIPELRRLLRGYPNARVVMDAVIKAAQDDDSDCEYPVKRIPQAKRKDETPKEKRPRSQA